MKDQIHNIEKLMKELLRLRDEYSQQSADYIQQATLLVSEHEAISNDNNTMQDCYLIHDKHKQLTQHYHQRVTQIHEKISHAMTNIT